MDAHSEAKNQYRQGFEAGHQVAVMQMEDRVRFAEAIADHWYFIANNPGSQYAEDKRGLRIFEIRQARAEHDRLVAEWDAEERAAIERAKAMIWADVDDMTIAIELGLHLPMVANIRSGVLA